MVKSITRPNDAIYDVNERYKKAWDFNDSIFKNYKDADLTALRNRDWETSKMKTFVKSDTDKNNLRKTILDNYLLLKDLYKHYSAIGVNPGEIPSVS